MKTVITKSFILTIFIIILTFFVRSIFHTESYLTDVGGLGGFVTVFGTLFGIMTAFIVFEVWNQYNQATHFIDQEAQGLERLYRLTIYFRDDKLTKTMKQAIESYAGLIIHDRFKHLGSGQHNKEASKKFRTIAHIIRTISFDDDHDQTVFNHVIQHYGELSEIRTQRITQSLTRLPILLKIFLYVSSAIAIMTFVLMPFANTFYALFVAGSLTFTLGMTFQLVEDLDNPFVGHWNISPEPFERALKHIEEDY